MRIMFYTDPPFMPGCYTGYSKVAYYIIKYLPEEFEIAYTPMAGVNHMGVFRFGKILLYNSGEHPFSEDVIQSNYYHFNADIVLVLKDLFAFSSFYRFPLNKVYYVPVDHEPLHPDIPFKLKTAFKVVAMSSFGRKLLEKNGVKVDVTIPHGYEPSIYFPREDREECRRFLDLPLDGFIIGVVGRNQIRKNIPRAIQVFKHLLDSYGLSKCYMFLWTNIDSKIPLRHMIYQYGLDSYIYYPSPELYRTGIPEKHMGKLYNAIDVLIGTGCEGFWLPGIEANACGIPTVHVDYAAASEISVLKARVKEYVWNNEICVRQPLVDLDDMCRKILKIYNDWDYWSRKALEKSKGYDWKTIVSEKWVPFLRNIEVEVKPLIKNGKITVYGGLE